MSSVRATPSIVNALLVVVVVAVVTSLGLSRFQETRVSAEAARVVSELRTVVEAVRSYQAATGDWPPDAGRGEVPAGLAPFLPAVRFTDKHRALEWDKFGVSPSHSGYILGITLSSGNPRLRSRIIAGLRSEYPYFVSGHLVTWILPECGELVARDSRTTERSGD
ncbi:MAG: hypothetical protein KJZ47_05285 [Gemmatimonadales bacterium]|nr:hypothetical protein [Gemmatimonadales bacterium]